MVEGIETSFENYAINSKIKTDNELSANIKEKNIKFSDILKENIGKVNNYQKEADKLTENFALGKTDNIHQVTIATEKARLALDLTTAIQGKVMEAYEELRRIQV